MSYTLKEMKEMNEKAGHQWFSKANMRLFGTKIEVPPNKKGLFITSEYVGAGLTDRAYTIRHFDKHTGHVDTVNEFQQYETLEDAKEAIKWI